MRTQDSPTTGQARAALAEAEERARAVRWADGRFRPALLVLAAMYVAIGIVTGFFPRGGSPFVSLIPVVYVAGIVATFVFVFRGRVRSRAATAHFCLAVAVFSLWNAAVIAVSVATGWWSSGERFHATVSFAIAALPLVAAAWLIGRR